MSSLDFQDSQSMQIALRQQEDNLANQQLQLQVANTRPNSRFHHNARGAQSRALQLGLLNDKSKQLSRWGPVEEIPYKPIPHVDLPIGLSEADVDQFLRESRLEDLTDKIRRNILEDADPDIRPPSPPPIYDRNGTRTNTREIRIKKSMLAEQNRLVRYMLKNVSGYSAPPDWRPQKLQKKILIPTSKYPNVQFVSIILGARGTNHKRLQEESGCKISVRGKGMKDEKQEVEDSNLPQHIHLESDHEEQLDHAERLLAPLLNPESQEFERARVAGLETLATMHGLSSSIVGIGEKRCAICGALGHYGYECPEHTLSIERNLLAKHVVCIHCGDRGHVSMDCPLVRDGKIGKGNECIPIPTGSQSYQAAQFRAEAEKQIEVEKAFADLEADLLGGAAGPSSSAMGGKTKDGEEDGKDGLGGGNEKKTTTDGSSTTGTGAGTSNVTGGGATVTTTTAGSINGNSSTMSTPINLQNVSTNSNPLSGFSGPSKFDPKNPPNNSNPSISVNHDTQSGGSIHETVLSIRDDLCGFFVGAKGMNIQRLRGESGCEINLEPQSGIGYQPEGCDHTIKHVKIKGQPNGGIEQIQLGIRLVRQGIEEAQKKRDMRGNMNNMGMNNNNMNNMNMNRNTNQSMPYGSNHNVTIQNRNGPYSGGNFPTHITTGGMHNKGVRNAQSGPLMGMGNNNMMGNNMGNMGNNMGMNNGSMMGNNMMGMNNNMGMNNMMNTNNMNMMGNTMGMNQNNMMGNNMNMNNMMGNNMNMNNMMGNTNMNMMGMNNNIGNNNMGNMGSNMGNNMNNQQQNLGIMGAPTRGADFSNYFGGGNM